MKIKLLTVLTAAVTAFSMLSPITAAGADTKNFALSGERLAVSDFDISSKTVTASSVNEAVSYVRENLKKRKYDFSVSVPRSGFSSGLDAAIKVLAEAISETDKGDEGDYLRFSLKSYKYGADSPSRNTYNLYYRITYYSSPEDEEAVSREVEKVISALSVSGKSEYEKVRAVYNFVTSNAKYAKSYDNERIFTAYGALIDKTCVCQGYSLLLYRLLKEVGINCRILSGKADEERHSWNIVKIGSKYYYLDPTWDSELGGSEGAYFLRGVSDFDNFNSRQTHTPVFEYEEIFPDYESDGFRSQYPQAESRFILGDATENGIIDGNDASYVLTCYAAMSVNGSDFTMSPEQRAKADITGDCIVDAKDASQLLAYYAYTSAGSSISLDKYLNKR